MTDYSLKPIEKGIILSVSAMIIYFIYSPQYYNYVKFADYIPSRQRLIKNKISKEKDKKDGERPPILV